MTNTVSLRALPKLRDSISYLYIEHARIEQEDKSIAIFRESERYAVPCASLSTLLLGPGTNITHAAIKTLGDNGCSVQWVGEDSARFYAHGRSPASGTDRLLHQATVWADPQQRLAIVRRMYTFRFEEVLSDDLTLEQIRGREGVRVRTAYQRLSKATGVTWNGRNYKQNDWDEADPINQALSTANACLYSVCQTALVTVGYSPALGFVHTGKPLSFVYDVADLYKVEITIPAAFETLAEPYFKLGEAVRRKCREKFVETKLMQRIISDIDQVLGYRGNDPAPEGICLIWDDRQGEIEGGRNWGDLAT
ncbi:type I-E CRISPR-associated endonuclease Cas1e [Synechococcus elongatus]|uniref:type I-E CRISPR-associated endonuclease Cas1e n=1 Tax=Synechococcus elongatus TaxID=32046 RepID=UPI0030CA7967